MSELWKPGLPWIEYLLRPALVYFFVLLLLRIGGKRQVGQMGIGEFVGLLLLSNAVQNAMNGGDNSLSGGLLLAAVLVGCGLLLAYVTYRSRTLEDLIDGRPSLLVHLGQPVERNLRSELMTLRDLKVRLRHQGVHRIDDVAEAVLENDGSLSVIRKSEMPEGPKGA